MIDATKTIYVVQGEFHVSRSGDEVLSTVLGSCVSACMWDEVAGVGGMNHFLLPHGRDANGAQNRYGAHAMEVLINGILKAGGNRLHLKAKLFGGARITANLSDIGAGNAKFAKTFLENEGIPCVAESLGGTQARRVLFRPVTGQARMMLVPNDPVVAVEVRRPPPEPPKPKASIELF